MVAVSKGSHKVRLITGGMDGVLDGAHSEVTVPTNVLPFEDMRYGRKGLKYAKTTKAQKIDMFVRRCAKMERKLKLFRRET